MGGKENQEWGAYAEQLAADYLLKQGYVIRERNWRLGNTHEIDLIIQDGNIMAFVEVKARRDSEEEAIDAVDRKKMKKIVQAADVYLRMQPHDYFYRFDIVTIIGTPDNYILTHYPEAFLPMVNGRY